MYTIWFLIGCGCIIGLFAGILPNLRQSKPWLQLWIAWFLFALAACLLLILPFLAPDDATELAQETVIKWIFGVSLPVALATFSIKISRHKRKNNLTLG